MVWPKESYRHGLAGKGIKTAKQHIDKMLKYEKEIEVERKRAQIELIDELQKRHPEFNITYKPLGEGESKVILSLKKPIKVKVDWIQHLQSRITEARESGGRADAKVIRALRDAKQGKTPSVESWRMRNIIAGPDGEFIPTKDGFTIRGYTFYTWASLSKFEELDDTINKLSKRLKEIKRGNW